MRGGRRSTWQWPVSPLWLCVVLGLLVRHGALLLAPQQGYLADHMTFMAWSAYAYDQGPARLYDLPDGALVSINLPVGGGLFRVHPGTVKVCNYPPFATGILWLQGAVWRLLDRELATGQDQQSAGDRVVIRAPLTNTLTARLVNAVPSVIADYLMAWGVMVLVRALRPGPRSEAWETIAFAITILAPPVIVGTAWWNQADSWLMALLIWCLVFLVAGRFALAGLLYGIALMTKQQAILFLPVLAYIFLSLLLGPAGSWRQARKLLWTAAMTVVTVLVIAVPFSWPAPSRSGTWLPHWFQRCYVEALAVQFPFTTLKAFNIWWLDSLAHGHTVAALDPTVRILGLSKDALGKVLLAMAIVTAGVLCARRWGWARPSWPAFAFLTSFAAFLLPTRVHERYLYYGLPFLITAVFSFRLWTPTLVAVLVVASFETTWFVWYGSQADWPGVQGFSSTVEWLSGGLAGLSVAAFVYSLAVLWTRRSPAT